MKRLYLVLAVVVGVVLYLHRGAVHEVVVDTAIGIGCLAGLCLAAAGAVSLASRRKGQPARLRSATRPAVAERPRATRPAGPCAEACGQPATRVFGQWLVCDECGGRLDAAAERAGRPADDDLPVLAQLPVIPEGETIGRLDMSDFENRGTL